MRDAMTAVFLLAVLLAPPVVAQTVTPQPATTIDPIEVSYQLLEDGCFSSIEGTTVDIDGFEIEVDVQVGPWRGAQRCTPPVPLVLQQTIGRLPAGDYQLSISGTIFGNPFGPETTTFSVGAGPFGDLVSPIPTLGPWSLLILAGLVGGVAAFRMRPLG